MPQTCNKCYRTNPDEAFFCYLDGNVLHGLRAGPLNTGAQPFYSPFVFPSGRNCRNFDELALACQELWPEALRLLQQGYLEGFLGSIGRADLATAARDAARSPDPDRGLDQLLTKLPSQVLESPRLYVTPQEINLGQLRVGQDHRLYLHLVNQGMGLLYGTVRCEDCLWLALGDAAGAQEKLVQFRNDLVLAVHVRGKQLRAGNKALRGSLVIDTNGGSVHVPVRAEVPVAPFPDGALAGAVTPRQVAEKARAAPRDAAPLFENGVVARWYEANGWKYPVQGPAATGLGAVQQFFEALGLTSPPPVELSATQFDFLGKVGDRLNQVLEVKSSEKRPVYAHATSDQPWLEVGRPRLQGRIATIGLTIPAVPDRPGETLRARLTVMANGNQQFTVPVSLAIRGTRVRRSGVAVAPPEPAWALPADEVVAAASPAASTRTTATAARRTDADAIPVPGHPETVPERLPPRPSRLVPEPPSVPIRPGTPRARFGCLTHLVPALVLLLALGGIAARDYFFKPEVPVEAPAEDEVTLLDPTPRLAIRYHDVGDLVIHNPSMRFGLVMLQEDDPLKTGQKKKLTYDPLGRSNNTCLKIDGGERLFGENEPTLFPEPPGHWEGMKEPLGGGRPWTREGAKSTWVYDDVKVAITQTVEIVPGEQSHLLDTCLVRYRIENRDGEPHRVGLRFLLDTYIGANDGVPFLIPGSKRLCDTKASFDSPADVPDFIEALEHENLVKPGTVAQLQFRLGKQIESPDRVTLGAWPDKNLAHFHPYLRLRLRQQLTGWDVPVLPLKTITPPDSAVTIYWNERPLAPGEVREVGFTYGLGDLAGAEAHGKLALTVGGALAVGREFTVTAYVSHPQPRQKLTLVVPEGFQITAGSAEQVVPPLPKDASSPNSPVTWKVRAAKAGTYTLKVQSSTGETQSKPVTIRSRGILD
jgi:hypothetical protein